MTRALLHHVASVAYLRALRRMTDAWRDASRDDPRSAERFRRAKRREQAWADRLERLARDA